MNRKFTLGLLSRHLSIDGDGGFGQFITILLLTRFPEEIGDIGNPQEEDKMTFGKQFLINPKKLMLLILII